MLCSWCRWTWEDRRQEFEFLHTRDKMENGVPVDYASEIAQSLTILHAGPLHSTVEHLPSERSDDGRSLEVEKAMKAAAATQDSRYAPRSHLSILIQSCCLPLVWFFFRWILLAFVLNLLYIGQISVLDSLVFWATSRLDFPGHTIFVWIIHQFVLVFPSSLFMDSDSDDVEESHPQSQEVPSPVHKLNAKNLKVSYTQVFLTDTEASPQFSWDWQSSSVCL